MTTPDYFLPEQFCNSGVQSIDYVIPPVSSADPAAASLETGAPPLQQVKPSLGGAVFPRQQYNGALRLLSNILTYLNKGGEFTFDSKNTAGYALDAVLYDYASKRYVVSLHNANTANFVTNPTLINGTDWAFISVTPAMLDIYAKLSSPAFTDTPTAPTAPFGTNTEQLATTEFVLTNTMQLRGSITTGTDLNTVRGVGVYIQLFDESATLDLNYPVVYAGELEVYTSGIFTFQRYTTYAPHNRVYTRGMFNSVWGSWNELATTTEVAAASVGTGQTWQEYSNTDRAYNVTYTNTTGKPIMVSVRCSVAIPTGDPSAFCTFMLRVGANTNVSQWGNAISNSILWGSVSAMVPPGQTYYLWSQRGGQTTSSYFFEELR